MAGIGDLVVNLKANASQFNKEMASAKSSVKGFHGIAVPSFKSIASAAASMINPIKIAMTAVAASAVSAGVAIYGLNQRIGEIAGLADKAAQFGVSVKFLQQLEFAADQSGVSAETLSKSIGKLTIAVGNAASGSKPAQEAFARLGLDFAKLQMMSPEQQFMEVARAISALPTQADKASASVAIFGKSGLEMTTLFAGGMNDINALMKEAQSLGIGLSEADVARVAAADDALQKMKASFGALVDQAIVGLAPTFQEIANTLTGWIAPLTRFLDAFNSLQDKGKWIRDVFQAVANVAFQHMVVKWDETIATMTKKAKEFGKSFYNMLATGDMSGMNEIINNASRQRFNERQLKREERNLERILKRPFFENANQRALEEQARRDQQGQAPQQPGMMQSLMPWLSVAQSVGKDLLNRSVGSIAAVQANKAEVAPATSTEFRSVPPAFATAANRGSAEAFNTILRSQRPEVKAMTTVAQQAQQQTALQRQIARNTTPQFAPEF